MRIVQSIGETHYMMEDDTLIASTDDLEVARAWLEPIRPPETPSATRYASNHNWSYRGDNTKPKEKK